MVVRRRQHRIVNILASVGLNRLMPEVCFAYQDPWGSWLLSLAVIICEN